MNTNVKREDTVLTLPGFRDELRTFFESALSDASLADVDSDALQRALRHLVGSLAPGRDGERYEVRVGIDVDDSRAKVFFRDSRTAMREGDADEPGTSAASYTRLNVDLLCSLVDEMTLQYKNGFEKSIEFVRFLNMSVDADDDSDSITEEHAPESRSDDKSWSDDDAGQADPEDEEMLT